MDDIEAGESYYAIELGCPVKVLSVDHKRKEVQTVKNNIKFVIPVEKLRNLKNRPTQSSPQIKINIEKKEWSSWEIDARGLRLEPFQDLVAKALDALISGEIPFLHIIHGHGEGILKGWLRDYLNQRADLTWGNADGNDGLTRIQLRDR